MGLLDSILGKFNSGQLGGFTPDSMIANAPSSGYLPPSGGNLPEDQVSTPPTDPYGNPVGGPAAGVPLPRPRPPEAGPAAFSPPAFSFGMSAPEMRLSESGGNGDGPGGGLAAALGLNPDRAKTVMASLAGGLSNVKNSPFAAQVAANAAGGAIAGGNKAEDTEINQALKLQQIKQKAPVIDQETRRAAQADRRGTLAQALDAVVRDPSQRAAIIERLRQLGIAF
jgi:uncharacterized membrane protein